MTYCRSRLDDYFMATKTPLVPPRILVGTGAFCGAVLAAWSSDLHQSKPWLISWATAFATLPLAIKNFRIRDARSALATSSAQAIFCALGASLAVIPLVEVGRKFSKFIRNFLFV